MRHFLNALDIQQSFLVNARTFEELPALLIRETCILFKAD